MLLVKWLSEGNKTILTLGLHIHKKASLNEINTSHNIKNPCDTSRRKYKEIILRHLSND